MKRILLLLIILCIYNFFLSGQEMDKYKLYEVLEKNDILDRQFKIRIDGKEQLSYFSKKNFVYYEEVLYTGDIESKSEYYTPYVTEKSFYIVYKNQKYEVYYKDIRTYLKESYEKVYTNRDSDIPDGIKETLKKDDDKLLINVYGLKKRKTYYALFHVDTYMIDSEEGVKKKENIIIWISDKPLKGGKPQVDLTPIFQGWTY